MLALARSHNGQPSSAAAHRVRVRCLRLLHRRRGQEGGEEAGEEGGQEAGEEGRQEARQEGARRPFWPSKHQAPFPRAISITSL